MTRRKNGSGDYDVGFGRPPRSTRFRPGQSGNPKGRPKAVTNVDDVLRKRLFAKVSVQENGIRKKITVLEAILGRLIKNAADGDPRSFGLLLKLLPRMQTQPDPAAQTEASPERDRQVLEEFARMLGTSLDTLIGNEEDAHHAEG